MISWLKVWEKQQLQPLQSTSEKSKSTKTHSSSPESVFQNTCSFLCNHKGLYTTLFTNVIILSKTRHHTLKCRTGGVTLQIKITLDRWKIIQLISFLKIKKINSPHKTCSAHLHVLWSRLYTLVSKNCHGLFSSQAKCSVAADIKRKLWMVEAMVCQFYA